MGVSTLEQTGAKRLEELFKNSFSPCVTDEELSELLSRYGLDSVPLIKKARKQAIIIHGDKERDNGGNIILEHSNVVTDEYLNSLIKDKKLTPDSIFKNDEIRNLLIIMATGGMIHDFEEKDKYYRGDPSRIQKEFGLEVSDLISLLTRPDYRSFPGRNNLIKKFRSEKAYRMGLLRAPEDSKDLKLIDRIKNTDSSISLFCGLYKGTIDPSYCTEKIMKKNAKYIKESPFYIFLANGNPKLQNEVIKLTMDLKFIYTVYMSKREGKLHLPSDKITPLVPSYSFV